MAKSLETDETSPGPALSHDHTALQSGLAEARDPQPARSDALAGLSETEQPGPAAGAQTAPSSPGTAAAASGDQLPFQSWERYKILSFLGAGGMGTVYKARDPKLNRYVAIKFLRTSQADGNSTRQRRQFEREARAQAALEHPHICKIYEVGEVDGQPYIAMQYIAGSSLSGLTQVLSVTEKLRVLQQMAEALESAHRQNLIHRDLKPGNMLVERRPDGTWWPYLMDFGLAREVDSNTQTSTGGVEGTPAYMAPEQARGETRLLDRRTDVYGLGATLYGVLTGRPPFVGSSTDVLMAVLLEDPPRLRTLVPSLAKEIETVVHKCLEKEPHRRYASAQALAEDLQRLISGDTIEAKAPSLWRRATLFSRRHKLLVASIGTALIATLILGSLALRIRIQAAEQARLAQRLGQEIERMEWMLRSARQLPLHDLNREKDLVRARMQALQQDLSHYGERSRGLAYYALGRGHLALHEYPAALTALQQAQSLGVQSPELHYALGLVLGKHFEQAIAQSRIAGGGEWAQKKLKEFEPKYLWPAIDSLQRSRAMKSDTPEYLEALIAFYQRDYDRALERATAAQKTAPWLYEASKLAGDVHLERALVMRDRGDIELATRAFALTIEAYKAASAIGASDAEVYEGSAEAWVRLAQMNLYRNVSVKEEYSNLLRVAENLQNADSKSHSADLKIATFANLTNYPPLGKYDLASLRTGTEASQRYLRYHPADPFAGEMLAGIKIAEGQLQWAAGQDPSTIFQDAIQILNTSLKTNPTFLWGFNDLGSAYAELVKIRILFGKGDVVELMDRAISAYESAARLDPEYVNTYVNLLWINSIRVDVCYGLACLKNNVDSGRLVLSKCISINRSSVECIDNFGTLHSHIALRLWQAGERPAESLKTAIEYLGRARRLGGKLLDAEQHVALTYWVQAMDQVERGEDPGGSLREMGTALATCLEMAEDDAMCRTLAARAELVAADYALAQGGADALAQARRALTSALAKAERATACKEKYPDAWQTLAETHLRLARHEGTPPAGREAAIRAGLAALQPGFAINPHHAQSLVVRGRLHLLRAMSPGDAAGRKLAAQAALESFAQAVEHDPLIKARVEPRRQQAQGVLASLP